MPCAVQVGVVTLVVLVLPVTRASAESQVRPFLGVTFGGSTTFIDLEHAAGHPNVAIGINGAVLGEVIGIEADVGYTPGFFQSGNQHLVLSSSATTVTGNFVIAVPRHLTQYTLRPYIVVGAGFMHAHINDWLGLLHVGSDLPATDVGGGVTGFLTDRIGLSWDVRYFRSVGRNPERGLSFGAEQLSFWRVNMAVAIRYRR